MAEVARYCESDVVNTYRIWLVYEFMRGALNQQELDWSEAGAEAFRSGRAQARGEIAALAP